MAVVKGSGKMRPFLPSLSINELRWEFLRRNKGYQKDFDKLSSLSGEKCEQATNELLAKWALKEPLDWRLSLPKNSYKV